MDLKVVHGDVLDERTDALIFSANEHLLLTGGLGASLHERVGEDLPLALANTLRTSGRRFAEVGETFYLRSIPPYRVIVALVAVDPLYSVPTDRLESALKDTARRLERDEDVSSVATVPLGTGYGDLSVQSFATILQRVWKSSSLPLTLCVEHEEDYEAIQDVLD